MRFNKVKFLMAGAALVSLSACASTTPALDNHSEDFGKAVAQNIAAQRVAPTPEQKENTFIPPNRARQKLARKNYEEGTVADPENQTTSGE